MKVMSRDKVALLLGVSTCRTTSFECFQHIHLSLRHSMTYPSMTSLSYFEDSLNWYFSSEGVVKSRAFVGLVGS